MYADFIDLSIVVKKYAMNCIVMVNMKNSKKVIKKGEFVKTSNLHMMVNTIKTNDTSAEKTTLVKNQLIQKALLSSPIISKL